MNVDTKDVSMHLSLINFFVIDLLVLGVLLFVLKIIVHTIASKVWSFIKEISQGIKAIFHNNDEVNNQNQITGALEKPVNTTKSITPSKPVASGKLRKVLNELSTELKKSQEDSLKLYSDNFNLKDKIQELQKQKNALIEELNYPQEGSNLELEFLVLIQALNAIENLEESHKSLKKVIQKIEEKSSNSESQKERVINDLKHQISVLENEKNHETLSKLNDELRNTNQTVQRELRQSNEYNIQLKNELSEFKEKVHDLLGQLQKKKDNENKKNEIRDLQNTINTLTNDIKINNQKIRELEQDKNSLQRNQHALESDIERLRQENSRLKAGLQSTEQNDLDFVDFYHVLYGSFSESDDYFIIARQDLEYLSWYISYLERKLKCHNPQPFFLYVDQSCESEPEVLESFPEFIELEIEFEMERLY